VHECVLREKGEHATRSKVQEGVPGDDSEVSWPTVDGSSPACDSDEPKQATAPV
jgi:hypothetical protein